MITHCPNCGWYQLIGVETKEEACEVVTHKVPFFSTERLGIGQQFIFHTKGVATCVHCKWKIIISIKAIKPRQR